MSDIDLDDYMVLLYLCICYLWKKEVEKEVEKPEKMIFGEKYSSPMGNIWNISYILSRVGWREEVISSISLDDSRPFETFVIIC